MKHRFWTKSTYGLTYANYVELMQDLRDSLIGKDILIKRNYPYFDLGGEYNIDSINEKIQKEINDMVEAQY